MNWKIFFSVLISAAFISFPGNIIGCGPSIDPFDYYASFFHPALADNPNYRPFYYSAYTFLYDESEPGDMHTALAAEWPGITAASVKPGDAGEFLSGYSLKDINNLYYHIEKNQPLKLPDSMRRNSMTDYFLGSKNLEALGYILFARQASEFTGGDQWSDLNRDSLKMNRLMKNGRQLYAAAKDENFRLRYGYQVTRLALYSGQNSEAVRCYDELVAPVKASSILQALSLSLKAGALFRSGEKKQAAYLFSRAFAGTDVKKVSNYISFNWAIDASTARNEYLSLCRSKKEKADMLGLFALGNSGDELPAMKDIFQLDPSNIILEQLVVREINKLEETYFTPGLDKQPGGRTFYYTWSEPGNDSSVRSSQNRALLLSNFLHAAAGDKRVHNAALFETAAGYAALMLRDYDRASEYLSAAKNLGPNNRVNDQLMLTGILLNINRRDKIDEAFETAILPSVKWLEKKAINDTSASGNFYQNSYWKCFYRNLLSEVIAKRYHAQGELYKEVLAIGAADRMFTNPGYNSYSNATDYLREKLESKDVEQLYSLMTSVSKKPFEKYLVNFNVLTVSDVTDFAGTAYLREYNWKKAIGWFNRQKAADDYAIDTDPFIELLYDQEEKLPNETEKTSKLSFAREMLRLESLSKTDKANSHRYIYKMALGKYNMTYYGHAWRLVQYYRSGSDGYTIPKGANSFQREYYGCYSAHDYFKKAMDLSTDKNFKAKCLFMMAKCAQKQIRQPQYEDFGYDHYDQYQASGNSYFQQFKNNKYFPRLMQDYSQTAFYSRAVTSCSYLDMYVTKKQQR